MMQELYRLIEEKIKNAGYPGQIDGSEFYGDVSDEADNQENGTYILRGYHIHLLTFCELHGNLIVSCVNLC